MLLTLYHTVTPLCASHSVMRRKRPWLPTHAISRECPVIVRKEGSMKQMYKPLLFLFATAALVGCAGLHGRDVAPKDDQLTVGTVQKEIRIGMSGGAVAEVLGAPNIVSTDEQGREVWIYDRITREVRYSRSSGGILGLFVAGSGGLLPGGSVQSGAESSGQSTLTVIIKFDENKRVRDFGYHSSHF